MLSLRAFSMLGVLFVVWLTFYYTTGGIFLSPENLSNLMSQTAVTAILAVGMLMVIVSGNIDLSVGSVLGLAGTVAALSISRWGLGLFESVALALLIGTAIGSLHGCLTAYFRIPSFIVTLGGLLAWRGALKGLTGAETIPVSDNLFLDLGRQFLHPALGWALAAASAIGFGIALISGGDRKHLVRKVPRSVLAVGVIFVFVYVMNAHAGVPVSVLVMLALVFACWLVTRFTVFGRHLYAIGGNAEAAAYSGVAPRPNIVAVYSVMGFLTGMAALISTARLGSATVDAGTLKELDAIAACVIGGAGLSGGRGTVAGAVLGALIMVSLDNGMGLLGVGSFKQEIFKGAILVAAVGFEMAGRRMR